MRIAIIGTGRVGAALGRRFAAAGHELSLGSRRPDDEAVRSLGAELRARVDSPREAAAWAEIILLAIPWAGVEAAVSGLGDLSGKILVDATNPLPTGQPGDRLPADLGFGSGAEAVAAWSPGTAVVKAFNTTGAANLGNPTIAGHAIPALLCGEAAATARVGELAASAGFEPIVVGGLDRADLVESAARLWVTLAYAQGLGPDFAFVVARRGG